MLLVLLQLLLIFSNKIHSRNKRINKERKEKLKKKIGIRCFCLFKTCCSIYFKTNATNTTIAFFCKKNATKKRNQQYYNILIPCAPAFFPHCFITTHICTNECMQVSKNVISRVGMYSYK